MTDEEIKKGLERTLGVNSLPDAVWETLNDDYSEDLDRARDLRKREGENWEDIETDAWYAWNAIRRGMRAARGDALFGREGTGVPKRRLQKDRGTAFSENEPDSGYGELWRNLTPEGVGEEREQAEALGDYMALCASLNPGVQDFRRKVLGGNTLSPDQAHEFVGSLANRWFGQKDLEDWGTTPVSHHAVPVPVYYPDFDTGGECVILEPLGKRIFVPDDEMDQRFADYLYFPSRGGDFFGDLKSIVVGEGSLLDRLVRLRVHFKTLLETGGSRVRTGRSQQVFPYFGRVPIRTGTWSGGFEMRSKRGTDCSRLQFLEPSPDFVVRTHGRGYSGGSVDSQIGLAGRPRFRSVWMVRIEGDYPHGGTVGFCGRGCEGVPGSTERCPGAP